MWHPRQEREWGCLAPKSLALLERAATLGGAAVSDNNNAVLRCPLLVRKNAIILVTVTRNQLTASCDVK